MAKACVVVCIVVANLGDSVRTSHDNLKQRIRSHASDEEGTLGPLTGDDVRGYKPSNSHFVGARSPIRFTHYIPPIPPIPPIPAFNEVSSRDGMTQSQEEVQLGVLGPGKKDTVTFTLSEADHEPESLTQSAKTPSSSVKSRTSWVPEEQGPLRERPAFETEDRDATEMASFERALARAVDAYKQQVSDQQDFEDTLAAFTMEKGDLAFDTYESLRDECLAVLEEMRGHVDPAQVLQFAKACDTVIITLNNRKQAIDLFLVLDQLQDLEDKLVALTPEKDDLPFLQLAVGAYSSLRRASRNSSGGAISVDTSTLDAQIFKQAAGALKRSLEDNESLKKVWDSAWVAYLKFLNHAMRLWMPKHLPSNRSNA